MSSVHVKADVLKWALDRSRQSVHDVAGHFPKIFDWLSGDENPTLKQLESFAKATATPLGFLVLDTPPQEKLPIQSFRTVADKTVRRPSPNLIETIHAMDRRQGWMRDYLVEEGNDPLPFVAKFTTEDEPKEVANVMREVLKLEPLWASSSSTWEDALSRFHDAIEEVGILAVTNSIVGNNTHRKLDVDEFRGFVLVDDFAPLIFVNGSDVKAAQMFTLAHELAHVFLGVSGVFDLKQLHPSNDRIEQACNAIAAEFLVPESLLRHVWPEVADSPDPFARLSRRFKVSEIVAARRALDLDLIDGEAFTEFYREYISRIRQQPKPRGGAFYNSQMNRVGQRFGRAILRAVREGRLTYTGAYSLTGLYGKSFDNFAASFLG